MAVKSSYKIPDTLNKSIGDMEIAFRTSDGVGIRPLSIKVIMSYFGSGVLCIWILNNTFIAYGSMFAKVLFVLFWAALTALLMHTDKTKQMQLEMVPAALNYMVKSNRNVITRTAASPYGFYYICGIDDINENTGLISYTDGTYGFMYRVVGTGSILLFDEDRDAILNRVDNFYRKMKTDYELIFITAKESQTVYKQVANLKKRYDDLDDDGLKELADMQFNYLKNFVGGEFRSIHQYLIIKADNKEALTVGKNQLQSEVENSQMMIRQCTALMGDDLTDVLSSIYKGKESV